tara:strand:+ start:1535 stop:3217 length:1683 start_codon:yes stop_codon:yes gene_type:complete
MELFGFEISRTKASKEEKDLTPSFIAPETSDGAVELSGGSHTGTYLDLEGKSKTEAELVTKYRIMSIQPEADVAVQDIINEAIVLDDDTSPVSIELDRVEAPEAIKKKIREEFEYLLSLIDFSNDAYELFKRWYVDGRIYFHILINKKKTSLGIQELRYIDPRKIRKMREPIKSTDNKTGIEIVKGYNEFYMFNNTGLSDKSTGGIKVAPDSIVYCHSGILDENNNMVLSHLHKSIKPLNQLRMMEDAVVIYRLARAPERRVFYIDVGNLPKIKAEQHLRDMMTRNKNKVVYDAATGEIRDDRKFMTMLEDFWLPRREGGRGTEITTLPGGQNLGEMEDVEYFRKKLYKSLNVPISRLEAENQFNIGRSAEVTRDEVKFSKFVKRLRSRFSEMFDNMLEIHLALKGIVRRSEFKEFKQNITYNFAEDNHFTELKESEILRERLGLLQELDQFVGKYFSENYVRKNVLRMNEEDIKQIEDEIADEEKSGAYDDEAEEEQVEPEVPTANTNVKKDDDEEDKEEKPVVRKEKEISEEEKKLVESMTNLMESVANSDLSTADGE